MRFLDGGRPLRVRYGPVRAWLVGVGLVVAMSVDGPGEAGVLRADLGSAEQRLAAQFASRGVPYPPHAVALVALKSEARLEVWVDAGRGWSFVRSYLIRRSSGALGPKLREGDHQVPEGVYRVAGLNPTSRFHLALRLDYPNAFDRARAAEDGRTRLGGDIMIHGGAASDGCLPLGDAAIEDVFALVERVGPDNVSVVVSPVDFRRVERASVAARAADRPVWLPELYASIASALRPFALSADAPPARAGRARAARPGCRPYDERDCVARCEAGDVASCARAGLLYEGELGVAADATRAWSFLGRACDAGDAFGCAELARLYVADDGPRRDATRAAELADVACAGGDGHGCGYLARLCSEGLIYPGVRDCRPERVRQLREAAVRYLRGDCRGWTAYDCAGLATIYYPGDAHTALRFAAGACSGGDPSGCYTLGRLAEDGGDAAGATSLYARACHGGYRPGCERAGAASLGTIANVR
jgi:TPR repeat protein